MLCQETRELLVKAYEKSHNAKEAAPNFSVNKSTVYRLVKQMKETGSVEVQTSKRGRKPSLSKEDIENIDRCICEQSDITINEIIEQLGLKVSNETVRKAVIKLGYVYKKKSIYASERERLRCKRETQKME